MVDYIQARSGDSSQPCTAAAVSHPGVELDEAVDLQEGCMCTYISFVYLYGCNTLWEIYLYATMSQLELGVEQNGKHMYIHVFVCYISKYRHAALYACIYIDI